jgi:hypothetical protein
MYALYGGAGMRFGEEEQQVTKPLIYLRSTPR